MEKPAQTRRQKITGALTWLLVLLALFQVFRAQENARAVVRLVLLLLGGILLMMFLERRRPK